MPGVGPSSLRVQVSVRAKCTHSGRTAEKTRTSHFTFDCGPACRAAACSAYFPNQQPLSQPRAVPRVIQPRPPPPNLGLRCGREPRRCERAGAVPSPPPQDREVTSLDLSNRFLGVAGARLAAEPLARAKALTRLNLSYNELGVTLVLETS